MTPTHRITLLKVPNQEDRTVIIEAFKVFSTTAKKDSTPYILSVVVGETAPSERAQGYTIAVHTTFASLEDMRYYETKCEAHMALRKIVHCREEGCLMTYFEAAVDC